jgi:glycosyltransferase involved in cell wall biosynthesis
MRTILASVYAVNPYKGSEDGTGWNLLLQIARFNTVIAVTRQNNRPAIEKYLGEHPTPEMANLRFEYFDLPYWMRFWKRGGKNALLYYYLWQLALPHFVRKRALSFDITHNLNFHNDWMPSFLWGLNKPFVWGPIGHHPQIPAQFLAPVYGKKKWLLDRIRWTAKRLFWHLDPFLRQTRKKATAIIAVNSDVNKQLRVNPGKLVLMPAVATNDMLESQSPAVPTNDTWESRSPALSPNDILESRSKEESFQIISVGRFVPLKGFDIVIRSFANFFRRLDPSEKKTVRLVIVGNGPELAFLRSLSAQEGLSEHVEIICWIERAAMRQSYSDSTAFFFPSHEGAGMVVPEALSCGLPVICFDNSGPGEFITADCGRKIPYSGYQQTIAAFADTLETLYRDRSLLKALSIGARKQFVEKFQWDQKGDILKAIYDSIP